MNWEFGRKGESLLAQKLAGAFERLSIVYRLLLWEKGNRYGLTPLQIQVLFYLREHREEKRKPHLLAAYFLVKKPTISETLRILEGKGFIMRRKDPQNKRSVILTLTSKGEKIIEKLNNFVQPLEESINALTPKERERLYYFLFKLIYSLYKQGVIQEQRMCFLCKYYEKSYKGYTRYCKLLEKPLEVSGLRLDCPDFQLN